MIDMCVSQESRCVVSVLFKIYVNMKVKVYELAKVLR
ncbi:hypothetical protein ECH_0855 [Ehrlichia chaffeensis str. Arkansas]|uniref:Uncharacterized protein n=1 Tax=Ehrlichia chaffeensis (strain ATCC CRL-10679 / Arkansas) TaxID=205920 RepID=Q2GFY3_EHRCR|nr:hypothetical protein ECH_0855 [Ehrlichia chaffeensis str. Arkansas]